MAVHVLFLKMHQTDAEENVTFVPADFKLHSFIYCALKKKQIKTTALASRLRTLSLRIKNLI